MSINDKYSRKNHQAEVGAVGIGQTARDSFYRFKELYEQGGEEALMDLSRKKPILKNWVPEHVERAVVELAIENPALGQKRASWQLQ